MNSGVQRGPVSAYRGCPCAAAGRPWALRGRAGGAWRGVTGGCGRTGVCPEVSGGPGQQRRAGEAGPWRLWRELRPREQPSSARGGRAPVAGDVAGAARGSGLGPLRNRSGRFGAGWFVGWQRQGLRNIACCAARASCRSGGAGSVC